MILEDSASLNSFENIYKKKKNYLGKCIVTRYNYAIQMSKQCLHETSVCDVTILYISVKMCGVLLKG